MGDRVRVWHPLVPGVTEVLHALFERHAYPAHVHDDWTVLSIDEGAVAYDLAREGHIAAPGTLTLLPPGVPHDGRSAVAGRPFRKRVLYLAAEWMPAALADAAVRRPTLTAHPPLARLVDAVHAAVAPHGDPLAAEGGVLTLADEVRRRFGDPVVERSDSPLAARLRTLLDDRLAESITLKEAGTLLQAHPSHLVRAFSHAYGISPHRYLIARRVDRARHLLGRGHAPATVAAVVGFHDQAHMSRHFRRVLGATPSSFREA
jgi:AraC-like DNA-binding protein